MRHLIAVVLAGGLVFPSGWGPGGCQTRTQVGCGSAESQRNADGDRQPGSGSTDNGAPNADADPLVPPIRWNPAPVATHEDPTHGFDAEDPPGEQVATAVLSETPYAHSFRNGSSPFFDAEISLFDPLIARADFSSDPRAHFHPHGEKVCASGCAASNHPTARLSSAHFRKLLGRFAVESMDETSPALEELLYYGRQSAAWLQRLGADPLDAKRAEFLSRELQRTHAVLSFRLVDADGVVRCYMPPTRVPLDRRHVFDMETNNLPPLVTSGTVKRVGLHHLWTRI